MTHVRQVKHRGFTRARQTRSGHKTASCCTEPGEASRRFDSFPTYCRRGESVRSRTVRSKGQGDQKGRRGSRYTVHTINIISQRQYFVASCLWSCVGDVFGLHSICVYFPSSHKLVTYAKRTDWSRVLHVPIVTGRFSKQMKVSSGFDYRSVLVQTLQHILSCLLESTYKSGTMAQSMWFTKASSTERPVELCGIQHHTSITRGTLA
jgi:hypothetical protein